MNRLFVFCAHLLMVLFIVGCSFMNDDNKDISMQPAGRELVDAKKVVAESYYYYFDERIYLSECRDLVFLRFKDDNAKVRFQNELAMVSLYKVWDNGGVRSLTEKNDHNLLVLQSVRGDSILERILSEANNKDHGIVAVSSVFQYEEKFVAVNNKFSVKLKAGSSDMILKELARTYGCVLSHGDGFSSDELFVEVPLNSKYDVLELASLFYEQGDFEFTSPDFIVFNPLCSNDPRFSSQWGLKNTGTQGYVGNDISIEAAWAITEGSSDIVIAVLDDGVEMSHPDLSSNIVMGYDAVNETIGGYPVYNDEVHGTKVAGVIAAEKDNGIGISGVAPECRIMSIRVLDADYLDYEAAVRGFNWARDHGADVINCSWGGNPSASITNAITSASLQGRGGNGCVLVFAAGNFGYNTVSWPASLSCVVAVGASSYDGKRKTESSPDGEYWASSYGSALDVVAPGVKIETTTRFAGYVEDFHATSSAAPFVSGIAALVLSEFPDLPQEMVRKSITRGCANPLGYYYHEDDNYPVDYRCDEVGYGLIKAHYSLSEAYNANQQVILDNTAGLDFTITNWSSYQLDNIILDIRGNIGGQVVSLISCDLFDSLLSGKHAGYPVYRGESLSASPGEAITGITVDLYASSIDCPGNLSVGVAFDTPTPNTYTDFDFGTGNSFQTILPSIEVPNATRRRVYIKIFDSISN